jgi:hypothetical protein
MTRTTPCSRRSRRPREGRKESLIGRQQRQQRPPRPPHPAAKQASARLDDLALRLSDADGHQLGVRRLAPNDVARGADVRARDDRGTDRDLRVDAASTQTSRSAPDERQVELVARQAPCLASGALPTPSDQITRASFLLKVKPWQVFVDRREPTAGQRVCDRIKFLTTQRTYVDPDGHSASVMAPEPPQLAAGQSTASGGCAQGVLPNTRAGKSAVTCSLLASHASCKGARAADAASPTPVTCAKQHASGRDHSTRRARQDF